MLHFLWTGQIGGAERAVYQLVREQMRRGTRVGVAFGQATGLYADSLRELGCPVISLGASGGADIRVLPGAVRAIRGFDVHHFHGVEPLTFIASILSGSKARVFTQRAGIRDADTFRKRLRRRLAKHALRHNFHAWCGNTPHAKETLIKVFQIPPDAIDVVHNGLDLELLRPQASRSEVRRSFGISDDAFVVGSTAVLKVWKRMHLLLEAGAMLERTGLTLLVVGDGPDRPRLEDVAGNLGIQDLVVFTGMQDRVVELVSAMDAFVLPSSDAETFGNSLVEAMALGVPSTVFMDSPGIRGHIDSEKTGFVVGDVDGLRDVLNRLRFDPGLGARVGKAGARFVRETYGIDRTAEGYAAAYLKALSRWAARDSENSARSTGPRDLSPP
ncbi:MAG: glycosyltransferase [Acidimicrobiia bacterium]